MYDVSKTAEMKDRLKKWTAKKEANPNFLPKLEFRKEPAGYDLMANIVDTKADRRSEMSFELMAFSHKKDEMGCIHATCHCYVKFNDGLDSEEAVQLTFSKHESETFVISGISSIYHNLNFEICPGLLCGIVTLYDKLVEEAERLMPLKEVK